MSEWTVTRPRAVAEKGSQAPEGLAGWPFNKPVLLTTAGPVQGLEITVVGAEDSGEQPGNRFDVTLGLGF